MSEFDMQNQDVFQIVHDNPRRRGVIRDIGVIVPNEQAQRFAVYEASQSRGGDWKSMAAMVAALFVTVTAAVLVLA